MFQLSMIYAAGVWGLILGLHPDNGGRRYFVTTSPIGWVQAWNQLFVYSHKMFLHSAWCVHLLTLWPILGPVHMAFFSKDNMYPGRCYGYAKFLSWFSTMWLKDLTPPPHPQCRIYATMKGVSIVSDNVWRLFGTKPLSKPMAWFCQFER